MALIQKYGTSLAVLLSVLVSLIVGGNGWCEVGVFLAGGWQLAPQRNCSRKLTSQQSCLGLGNGPGVPKAPHLMVSWCPRLAHVNFQASVMLFSPTELAVSLPPAVYVLV